MIAFLIIVAIGGTVGLLIWAVKSRRVDPGKTGAVRFMKGLSSEQEKQQKALHFHETGVVSLNILNTPDPGRCELPGAMKAWNTVHRTKKLMEGVSEPILMTNDRSRFPDDPCNPLTKKEKDEMAAAEEVAEETVQREFSRLGAVGRESQAAIMSRITIWGSVGILGLALLLSRCGK